MAAGFFDSGSLTNHNHSSTVGDGGQLSNPTIAGVVTVTSQPSATLQLATTDYSMMIALLSGG